MSALVINIVPDETGDASALVRNLRYSFELVHASEGWKHAMGEGANLIVDQKGRVMFRPHFDGPRDLKTADRLIAGLLRRGYLRREDRVPAGKAGAAGA